MSSVSVTPQEFNCIVLSPSFKFIRLPPSVPGVGVHAHIQVRAWSLSQVRLGP